ncbi:uncharacterized protein LOC107852895 [Capsicum annuum]|uniref:uncharacterized protein LOC107852895 n=1 Tax=Capsicum annuum TaxID=4072 RepID=UPI001FB18728|nr:uncharacterized protein LOC107852895 [Capsicum annuum]
MTCRVMWVRKLHQLYAENSKERVEIYSRAITSQDNLIAVERLSKAKFLAQTAAKLLQSAKLLKGGLMWETPWIRFFKSCSEIPGENGIQNMELSIRGMEISLTSCPSFSTGLVKEELKDTLIHMSEQIRRKSDQVTHQETNGSDFANKSIFLHDDTMSPTQTSLPAFFFLFCAKMLLDNSSTSYNEDTQRLCHKSWMKIRPRKETLMFALKCSVSLGLAMWIGLLFDKQNGFWAGLTVASTLAQGKLATFTLANAQAQGIAFGSVYGVLGCSVFQKATNLRFLALLPWIIFSSFLKHSRISGHAGGISALLGAVMILGRKYSDPANEFAIIRLTETFIGLSCFIAVQFLLNPKRAASLARNQLYCTLDILKDCMNQIAQKDQRELRGLIEKQRKLKSHILNLQKLCLNAELEPDFWFLPFNATCYKKLQGSLSKIADLFYYVVYNINNMSHDFQSHAVDCKELHDSIYDELEYLKETTISLISTFLDKPSLMKLFPDDDDQEVKILHDLEEGKLSKKNDEKTERGLCFFLERSKEVIDGILSSQDKQELKGKTIISLYALEFCITSMLKVIKDIKMTMKELSHSSSSSRRSSGSSSGSSNGSDSSDSSGGDGGGRSGSSSGSSSDSSRGSSRDSSGGSSGGRSGRSSSGGSSTAAAVLAVAAALFVGKDTTRISSVRLLAVAGRWSSVVVEPTIFTGSDRFRPQKGARRRGCRGEGELETGEVEIEGERVDLTYSGASTPSPVMELESPAVKSDC